MNKFKESKAITLVALVITIIVLLILASVSLSLVLGENGIITRAKESSRIYEERTKEEQIQLEELEDGIDMKELEDDNLKTELKTIKLGLNVTEDNYIVELPVYKYPDEEKINSYEYDCEVDWGDGTEKVHVTTENVLTTRHTYINSGNYTVTIDGVCECLFTDYEYNVNIKEALVEVKQWGATGLESVHLAYCTNLKKIAEPSKNSFVNAISLSAMFNNCEQLESIPELLFANCPNVTELNLAFSRCKNLTEIPKQLFANCSNVTNFKQTFDGCNSITGIPEKLFANCPNVTNFSETFRGCNSITGIPEKLFANCLKVTWFGGTFAGCINVKGKAIEFWKEGRPGIDENNGGNACYAGCTGLEGYNQIPSYWRTLYPI